MEVKNIIDTINPGEIVAFIGDFNFNEDLDCKILPSSFEGKVSDYFLRISSKEKLIKALQVVDLSISDIEISCNELSCSLTNKLAITEALLGNEATLVLYNINKGLNYREAQNIKRVLKKLAEHNKKVVVITSDVEFLFNLTKRIYAFKNGKLDKEFSLVNWFDKEIYNYVSRTPIIEFVDYCRSRNIKIEDSLETKELLKAIYRSVGK